MKIQNALVVLIAAFGIHVSAFAVSPKAEVSLFEIPVATIDGGKTDLSKYRGKVLLIVNTASHCGYTPQYEGLQSLYKKYEKQGLVILGFPSNDFKSQEPGSNEEIKKFCELKYHVTFPMFSKAPVIGAERQPLYTYLMAKAPTHEEVGWNFEKFLIDRKGNVVDRFKSKVTPMDEMVTKAVEKQLLTGFVNQ